MTRLFDILFSSFGLLFGLPLLGLIALIGWFDNGSPLFWQKRVGRYQQPFMLVKFRSMRSGATSVPTHLADSNWITPFGHFLRRSKLDELPQLWNVLKGEMSLVGPRPGLFSQEELTDERASRGVFRARPGITGLAQVNGVNMSTPSLLAETDAKMLASLTVANYFRYMYKTFSRKVTTDQI